MALLPIFTYPDPVLKTEAKEVTVFDAELEKLAKDMAETMYHEQGIGLAANQIGVLKRILVVDVSREASNLQVFVNPKIVSCCGSVNSEEGCLSVPEYRDTVKRSEQIVIQAQDILGNPFEVKADGLLAICIQHEIDHLNGVLFVDRMSRLKRELFKRWNKKRASRLQENSIQNRPI